MSLKFRLALLYSLSVFIILLVSALSIFLFNENFRQEEFAKRLVLEASEIAELFSQAPGPEKSIIDNLNQNAASFEHEAEIHIFDSAQNLLYSTPNTAAPLISPQLFEIARNKREYIFKGKRKEAVLVFRIRQGRALYVFASAFDSYGRGKSDNLEILLSISVLGGLLLSAFLSFFYVRHAMNPLEELKNQIEKINERNLKERIRVGDNNNEVWRIAKKFNAMLDRLEQAFEQRKNFVHHASHELRTPLANMLSLTEAALSKNMSAGDLRQTLISLKEEQQEMIHLTNSLLTLSRYEKMTHVADTTLIRIDEVLYEAVDFAKQMWPNAMVTVDFETVPETEHDLELPGNESLIRAAIENLIKNSIHYSADGRVKVSIIAGESGITLHVDNVGTPLSAEEKSRLFIPFFRGENAGNKKGYGLGLSIVQRIVNVHGGNVSYSAPGNNLHRFTIHFPSGE